MIFDYDPRNNREAVESESASYRLLKDILTEQIVASLSTGTASNYITQSYGSNHRILYEGVGRLFADVILKSADNLEDVEYSQLRAEYISTRLLYSVFPNEESIPDGDNVGEIINTLLQTYVSLLTGATQKSIEETLNQITSNALVASEVNDYIINVSSSILAASEFNTDGVVKEHKHYAFSKPTGYGATLKPIGYRWGDELHTHEIIDGVIQPHTDEEGVSHTHDIFFGLPENVLQLQTNLRNVLNVLKPAHLKVGSVSSVLEEADRIAPNETDEIDGLESISLGLGSLYQEDLRKARVGVLEDSVYGYVDGNKIRLWSNSPKVANNLYATWEEVDPQTLQVTAQTQRLRVISVTEDTPPDQPVYSSGETLSFLRDVGVNTPFAENVRLLEGNLLPPEVGDIGLMNSTYANDGEPLVYSGDGQVYFLSLKGYEGEEAQPAVKPYGYRASLKTLVVTVDARVIPQGVVLFKKTSQAWSTRREISYATESFTNEGNDPNTLSLPTFFQKRLLKNHQGLPIIGSDLTLSVNGNAVQSPLFLDAGENSLYSTAPIFNNGDMITITYPKADSEIRLFRELNNLEITLNAVRPVRQVSLSGRGGSAKRVISTTTPISYVLNAVDSVKPRTLTEKISTYSVPTSDILNTKRQTLNSAFTLNRASLNLNLSQDQVFAPAERTLRVTSNEVLFAQLGFIPSYVYSVKDASDNSYGFKMGVASLTVENLETPTYLTISAISSTPLDLNQEWFKGEELAEGQAFLAKTDTSKVTELSENDPDALIQNPLGIGTEDQDRNIIANRLVQEEGQRGELAFYEDEVARYDLDGIRDFNPAQYEDRLLYTDPTLYILSPRAEVETSTVNTIPTYLFFNYFFLNTFGGDSHYFSIYRVGLNGVKYYQTITPRADSDGFFAFEEYPNLPAPNGAPLAYRFIDDGSGGGFNLNYSNGEFADNYTAEINGHFNHIPHQTYFIELYMEEDGGGADSLFFFSSGTDAPFVLGTSWDTSNETYRLDDAFGGGIGVTYYYEVLFATNPGEVVSFEITTDDFPAYPKDPENVGATHEIGSTTYYGENLYPTPTLGFDPNVNFMPANPDGSTPYFYSFEDEISFSAAPEPSKINIVSQNNSDLPTITDTLNASLLLLPSSTNEIMAQMGDEVEVALRYQIPELSDSFSISDEVEYTYDMGDVLIGDTFSMTDEVATSYALLPTSQTDQNPAPTDDVDAHISSFRVQDTISLSDLVTATYSLNPLEVQSEVAITDEVATTFNYSTPEITEGYPALTDEVAYRIPSFSVASSFTIEDSVSTSLSLTSVSVGSTFSISDTVSVDPNYDPVDISNSVPVYTDQVSVRISNFGVQDTFSITDEVSVSLTLESLSLESPITFSDDVSTSYSYSPISVSSDVSPMGDFTSEVTALTPSESFNFSDDVSITYNYTNIDESSSFTISDEVEVTPKYSVGDSLSMSDSVSTSLQAVSQSEDSFSMTDEVTLRTPSLTLADGFNYSDEVSTTYGLTSPSVTDVFTYTDEVDATYRLNPVSISDTLSLSDDVSTSLSVSFGPVSEGDTFTTSDDVSTSIGIVTPSVLVALKYNEFANSDSEIFSIYKGSMDTLEYPIVASLEPDSNDITATTITEGSKETTISAALQSTAYTNANDDANIRVGPLEYDTDYTIYAHTGYVDDDNDIAIALKAGVSGSNPTGYLSGETYRDLMPSGGGFLSGEKYFLHTFRVLSSDGSISFTADSENEFAFYMGETVRMYMHFIYTHSVSGDDGDTFRLREARPDATFSNPNGSTSDATGWTEPSIHATITGLGNVSSEGSYVETTLPNSSVANSDNDAQVSWQLGVDIRYHLQTTQYDNNPDFEVYLEPRTDDNGSSWNTTYSSADTLTYTELVTANDGLQTTWNHFFTVRRDGFIIWEQDPGS
jgi:hypothetical protein